MQSINTLNASTSLGVGTNIDSGSIEIGEALTTGEVTIGNVAMTGQINVNTTGDAVFDVAAVIADVLRADDIVRCKAIAPMSPFIAMNFCEFNSSGAIMIGGASLTSELKVGDATMTAPLNLLSGGTTTVQAGANLALTSGTGVDIAASAGDINVGTVGTLATIRLGSPDMTGSINVGGLSIPADINMGTTGSINIAGASASEFIKIGSNSLVGDILVGDNGMPGDVLIRGSVVNPTQQTIAASFQIGSSQLLGSPLVVNSTQFGSSVFFTQSFPFTAPADVAAYNLRLTTTIFFRESIVDITYPAGGPIPFTLVPSRLYGLCVPGTDRIDLYIVPASTGIPELLSNTTIASGTVTDLIISGTVYI